MLREVGALIVEWDRLWKELEVGQKETEHPSTSLGRGLFLAWA